MTNRVEFELEIQGFRLKVKGSKENAGQITAQVGQALLGVITPPSIDGKQHQNNVEDIVHTEVVNEKHKKRPRKAKIQTDTNGTNNVIDFTPEPEKYGVPSIKWTTGQKSLWLLYVVKQLKIADALTTTQIIETFNKHFRQSKQISNVARDLGKMKIDSVNMWVAEDTSKNPSEWYITEPGEKHVQKMIMELKTSSNGTR
jgi:hypothetical protein